MKIVIVMIRIDLSILKSKRRWSCFGGLTSPEYRHPPNTLACTPWRLVMRWRHSVTLHSHLNPHFMAFASIDRLVSIYHWMQASRLILHICHKVVVRFSFPFVIGLGEPFPYYGEPLPNIIWDWGLLWTMSALLSQVIRTEDWLSDLDGSPTVVKW